MILKSRAKVTIPDDLLAEWLFWSDPEPFTKKSRIQIPNKKWAGSGLNILEFLKNRTMLQTCADPSYDDVL